MSSAQSMNKVAVPSADATGALVATPAVHPTWKSLYTIGGVAALITAALAGLQLAHDHSTRLGGTR